MKVRHPFGVWLAAAALSSTGDSISFFALGWVAAAHGPAAVSLVLTVESIPLCVLILAGGVLGDRFGVRRMMIACDAAMALVMATLAVGATRGVPLWSLVAVAMLSGIAAALRRPAEGVFPRLFHDGDQLAKRMALVGACLQVARVAGPVVGGVMVAAGGLPVTAGVDAATFAVVLVVLSLVRPPREADHVATAPGRGWRSVGDGLRAAARTPGVPRTVIAVMALAGSVLPLVMLCVPVAGRDRGWSAAFVGVVVAAWVAGGLVVTLIVARRGAPGRRTALVGPLLAAGGVIVLAIEASRWAGLGAMLVVGAGTTMFTAHLLPAFVERTPPDMLARFQSLLGLAQTGPVLVVTPVLGAGAAHLGLGAALAVVAVLVAGAALPMVERTRPGRLRTAVAEADLPVG
ncbi:MFS transporter [Nocardioides sp. YIM 152315]|uniref:MFS transporter n=1 Tax=Nocardioides sp. YIM 152315 TaxID=3031760 RepID=UPI0023D9C000|nr:MFS transporter [Nocardioides sp. YIM 152315]MDF1603870.1 MFS transporter [Nocardioides sp. YIM 152315]